MYQGTTGRAGHPRSHQVDWFFNPEEEPIQRPPCVRIPGKLPTPQFEVSKPVCGFCERPSCRIVCNKTDCSFQHAKLRVRRLCPNADHHRVKLLSDMGKCPGCTSPDSLLEIHSGPYQVLFGDHFKLMLAEDGKEKAPKDTETSSAGLAGLSLPPSPIEMEVKRISIDRPEAVMTNDDEVDALVANMNGLELADEKQKKPVDGKFLPSCICNRITKFVLCSACGFLQPKGRIAGKCQVHERSAGDLMECPECHSAVDLNEIC